MSAHVATKGSFIGVLTALLCLTGVTVWVATLDLGTIAMPVALAIAFFKASLVVYIFMGVRFNEKLILVAAISSVFWLFIMLSFLAGDYMSRHWEIVQGW